MTKQTVSQKDIYELVIQRFDRLEDKMDDRFQEVEKRVDVLEDFKGKLLGIAVIIGVMASAVSSWVWNKLTTKS